MRNIIAFIICMSSSLSAVAGGNNDLVKFPDNYKDGFTHYSTLNRQNGKQIADLYANNVAINSVKGGKLADGSVIVMEIYKPETDKTGKPVTGPDGLFKKSELAAVAVMKKNSDWGVVYPAEERAGDWGFALYKPDGSPKENELECAMCHTPLTNQDFLFSFPKLVERAEAGIQGSK